PQLIQSVKGMYSTAGDTIAFFRSLVQGRVFKKLETFSQMQSRWNRFGLPLDRETLRAPSWPIEYSFGLMRFQLPRIFTAFKKVPAVIGHSGSTGSWLFYCPEQDLYISGSVDELVAGPIPYQLIPKILTFLIR
ncbi:MAG: hypothetical protein SNJ78_05455, partial [Spirochaetales bacterium]